MLQEKDCKYNHDDRSILCKGIKIPLKAYQIEDLKNLPIEHALSVLNTIYMKMLPQVRDDKIDKLLN